MGEGGQLLLGPEIWSHGEIGTQDVANCATQPESQAEADDRTLPGGQGPSDPLDQDCAVKAAAAGPNAHPNQTRNPVRAGVGVRRKPRQRAAFGSTGGGFLRCLRRGFRHRRHRFRTHRLRLALRRTAIFPWLAAHRGAEDPGRCES